MSSFALIPMKETTIVPVIDIRTEEPLKNSRGEDMFIEILSADSKKYRKVLADLVRDNSNKKATKKTNDDIYTEQLANIIVKWNIELAMDDGNFADFPLTVQNAIYILDENRFIRDAIMEVVNDRKNFLLSH